MPKLSKQKRLAKALREKKKFKPKPKYGHPKKESTVGAGSR